MKQQLLHKKGRDAKVPDANPHSREAQVVDDPQTCISHRAYELYEQEGCCDGRDLDHWLQAEREFLTGKSKI